MAPLFKYLKGTNIQKYTQNNNFIIYRNNKVYKPTTTTTATTAGETDSTTPLPTGSSPTPLGGSLFNFIINRRITLRPVARDIQTLHQSSTPTSAADLSLGESPAARAAPDKDTDSNVVYVTAVGASSDQQAIAYVNMNAGFNNDKMSNEEIVASETNDNSTAGILYKDDDTSTMTDITTSKMKQ
jgi:hypothetical protein